MFCRVDDLRRFIALDAGERKRSHEERGSRIVGLVIGQRVTKDLAGSAAAAANKLEGRGRLFSSGFALEAGDAPWGMGPEVIRVELVEIDCPLILRDMDDASG